MNRNLLDELTDQVNRLLPRAGALGEETRQQIRSALHRAITKMDLPDREEFERQREALERAERHIGELEMIVAGLEARQRAPDSDKDS